MTSARPGAGVARGYFLGDLVTLLVIVAEPGGA